MRTLPLWLLLPIILFFISANSYGKKSCEKQLNKLNKIQTKQRQGHSLKRSNTLNEQEHKARKLWWQCKKSPTKKRNNSKSKSKSKSKKQNNQTAEKVYKRSGATSNFKSSGAISVKEKYEGKKNFDWLNYYQQPEECKRPKKLSVFARCTEDRQAQQLKFEQNY